MSSNRQLLRDESLWSIPLFIPFFIQKPTKKSRWHQELAAVEYGSPCLQFMDFHRNDRFASESMKRESEDCLYLNVFSPYVSFIPSFPLDQLSR